MSIKRYIADKDATITDAYYSNLIERATDSNVGADTSLEIFSIFDQNGSGSIEKSRILLSFPIGQIINDRSLSKIPTSGNVKFILKAYNSETPYSLPNKFSVCIKKVMQSWDEGYGKDLEDKSDFGWNNRNLAGSGVTWTFAVSGGLWSIPGGTTSSLSEDVYERYFETGLEDLEVDITKVVEDWLADPASNYGILIHLSQSYEDGTLGRSFYTKRFLSREASNFFKKPTLEARWESIFTDDREEFYVSSSLLSEQDNTMNIYFYNNVVGTLKNIFGNVLPGVKFYSDSTRNAEIIPDKLQITNPLNGIYRAQVCLNTTSSVVYDTWYNTSSLSTYFTSSIDTLTRQNYDTLTQDEYLVNIINNKVTYSTAEVAKFRIFARKKDWNPNIYKIAYNNVENEIVQDLYYKIYRLHDNYTIIDYSTGSIGFSKTSYGSSGNYFDLDMSILEKDYTYGVKLARWNGVSLTEYPQTFKFKVE